MLRSRSERALAAWAIELLEVEARDRVLDAGCGRGHALRLLADRATAGCVVGVDVTRATVRQARRLTAGGAQGVRAAVAQASLSALPFFDAAFDRALWASSLRHWGDAAAALGELQRVLRPGGMLAVAQQPRWVKTSGEFDVVEESVAEQARAAGFSLERIERLFLRPVAGLCLVFRAAGERHG